MDPSALEELRDSIRAHGVLQPIVLRRHADGYQLIAGERRWRAARLAGLTRIPAVVRDHVSESEMLELALVENVQRRDLNPLERAEGFRGLMQQLNLTQEAVATKVGLKRSTVANHLRLLELPDKVQAAVAQGLISMGHARAFLGLSDTQRMLDLLEQTVRDDLSVRSVEREVRTAIDPPAEIESKSQAAAVPQWLPSIERRLRESLATKVRVSASANGRGSITIDFYSRTDLERLINQLAPLPTI